MICSIDHFLIRVGMKIKRKDIGSALGPESTLLWLGFSDLGNPAMEDSMGMLSMYPLKSDVWIPICDTSKHVCYYNF